MMRDLRKFEALALGVLELKSRGCSPAAFARITKLPEDVVIAALNAATREEEMLR